MANTTGWHQILLYRKQIRKVKGIYIADISGLSGLAPVEQLDLEHYQVNKPRKFQLPERGIYQLQAPASFPGEAFGVSKAGALTAQIDPTIVGPTAEGTVVKFQRVSAKVYSRDGAPVSQVGDYLAACGVSGVFTTPQELADAVESTAGVVYEAELDWQAYKEGFRVTGMKNFPKNEDGTYQPFVNHPTLRGEDGSPVRVWANLYIRNFIPAVR